MIISSREIDKFRACAVQLSSTVTHAIKYDIEINQDDDLMFTLLIGYNYIHKFLKSDYHRSILSSSLLTVLL